MLSEAKHLGIGEVRKCRDSSSPPAPQNDTVPRFILFGCATLTGCCLERSTLGVNHRHQVIPRFDERLGSILLELGRQSIDVDASLGKLGEHLLAVAAVGRDD